MISLHSQSSLDKFIPLIHDLCKVDSTESLKHVKAVYFNVSEMSLCVLLVLRGQLLFLTVTVVITGLPSSLLMRVSAGTAGLAYSMAVGECGARLALA